MQDFIEVLKNQKDVIIYKTYPARENYDFLGSAKLLCDNIITAGCECEYIDEEEKLYLKLDETAKTLDKVLFLGAGDIYDIAIKYLSKE
jgi:UDP-N-acetylmuramate-alanine ligase